jgi:hypothetical protein
MKYLCLGYHDENAWRALSDTDRDALLADCAAYETILWKNGHCIEGLALKEARESVSMRFDSGRVAITDGPFAETKEQLGGVMVLEATDLNNAIQLMEQLPCMRLGGRLEIRPINDDVYRDQSK